MYVRKRNKGLFILVKTSNPSSGEFQDRIIDGRPLYEWVGEKVAQWGEEHMGDSYSYVGAVVGATYPEMGKVLRKLMPKTFILVPGYGAQGGKGKDLVHFFNEDGLGAIVNSSRGIIAAYKQEAYAEFGEENYADASRQAVKDMIEDISGALAGRRNKQRRRKRMSEKTKKSLKIVSQEEIGKDIFSMWLQAEEMAESARPGQFLSLYTRDGSKLLPRPISICEIDRENKRIRLVYRVTRKNTGTEAFSKLHAGIAVEVLGPLGNGFPLYEAEGKRVFLMGGGIGIPPMLQTAKELNAEKTAVLGYRDELFLNEEFEKYADVFVATEDGSAGTKGNVMDAIRENALEADVIFACGPTPMLRAIKNVCGGKQYPVLDLYGGTYGLWSRCLSCLCVQIKRG